MSFTTTNLPEPSADALAHAQRLTSRIREVIDASGGFIGFDRYMQMALYEPGLGYYLAGAVKFGVDGDFVTAPDVSPLFGRCIARQARELFETLPRHILEFGAGSGSLAASILEALDEYGQLPHSYQIVELSPALRERQREQLSRLAPQARDCVNWLGAPPAATFDGLILANEIIDALPVKVFTLRDASVLERCVAWSGDRFCWLERTASEELSAQVRASLDERLVGSDVAYTSEINLGLEPWLSDLGRLAGRAVALIIDYGFPAREYYHAQREEGTLLCHFRHRAHADPFYYPGIQDITTSVDFTRVAETAYRHGLTPLGFAEQAQFLMSLGLLEDVEIRARDSDERERARIAQETKILTLPSEMGTRFKVLALGKAYNAPLRGFQLRDDRHRL